MRLAIDTNRYVDFCRGVPEAVDRIRHADWIGLPIIVIAELRAGFSGGSRSRNNERRLTEFLSSERVEVLYPDDGTAHHYARAYQQLRKQGTPIPTNDLWIAALVLEHDVHLFDRDKHFDHLPQLARL
jgi:tRNA(fMet)-specific endonuclease VapC